MQKLVSVIFTMLLIVSIASLFYSLILELNKFNASSVEVFRFLETF